MSVSILGGGISGLSALHFLKKYNHRPGLKIELYERATRPGGWITSEKGDFNFELGPRSIRSGSLNRTLDIIRDLELEDELAYPARDALSRFVARSGRLVKVPSSIIGVIREPMIRKYIPELLIAIFKDQGFVRREDESIGAFFTRHIGPDLTNYLIAPVFVGVNGSNINQLSMKTSQRLLFESSRRYKRFIRALLSLYFADHVDDPLKSTILEKGPMISFRGGLNTLPLRLQETHQGNIHLESKVKKLHFSDHKVFIERVGQRDNTGSDFVISALPAFEIAKLLRPHNGELYSLLNEIEYASMACVSVGFNRDLVPKAYRGFGFLVSPQDKDPVLGATLDSVIFPDSKDQTRITFMIGGHDSIHDHVVDVKKTPPEALESITLKSLKEHLNIHQTPDYIKVNICENAIPQHFVGHDKRMGKINQILGEQFPSIKLSNAFVRDMSINGCIDLSYDVATTVLDQPELKIL